MPYPPPPDQPLGPEYRYTAPGWPPPPMPPAKRSGGRIALFVVLGLVGLLCAFLGLGAILSDDDPKATPTSGTAAATEAAPVKAVEPKASDFTITAKVTEKTCYGSGIGCSVTWIPVVEYSGPAITGDDVWHVKYEVSGIESGTAEGTALVGSTGPAKQRQRHARTAEKGSKITVKVTGIERDR